MSPFAILRLPFCLGASERGPLDGTRYVGFVDVSGGGADSFALAVGHKQGEIGVLDCLREVRPPLSPEAVITEFADVLKTYRVSRVVGDRYGGEFPREQFRKQGIQYTPSPEPKGGLFLGLLPLLNSKKVRLLGNKRLISQLVGLERNTARGGKDSIDHARGGHDDLANAAAGVLVAAMTAVRTQATTSTYQSFCPKGYRPAANKRTEPLRIRTVHVAESEMEAHGLRAAAPSETFFRPPRGSR